MATDYAQSEEALVGKIVELTGLIDNASNGVHATASLAYAVNQLAEALAWLRSPDNSHGGAALPQN